MNRLIRIERLRLIYLLLAFHVVPSISGMAYSAQEEAAVGYFGLDTLVIGELGQLEPGLPLAVWRESHLTDSIAPSSPRNGPFSGALPAEKQTWCARATLNVELSASYTLRRFADFYPPLPPPSLKLPSSADTTNLAGQRCTLGRITVEVSDPAPSTGEMLARRVGQRLDALYGPGRHGTDLHGYRGIYWTQQSAWRQDSIGIIAAYVPEGPESRVLAIAWLPIACERVFPELVPDPCPMYVGSYYDPNADSLLVVQRMMRIASRDSTLANRLLGWFRRSEEGREEIRGFEEFRINAPEIVSDLEAWFAHADTSDLLRLAAAYFVADRVLEKPGRFAGLLTNGPQESLLPRLEALGASFEDLWDSPDISYGSDWLIQAWRLDPDGPVGRQAFLILLEKGAEVLGCDAPLDPEGSGREAFQCVIPAGGEALKGRLTGEMRARIHRLLGDAYRDIVTLAYGGHEYAPPQAYSTAAHTARHQAIAHYRAGLSGAPFNPITWTQWREAWRLIAGLTPVHTRFYYFCCY